MQPIYNYNSNSMIQELVSVIMPTYNASRFLAESITCVLNQTYGNIELLITDDHSTEKRTQELLDQFSQRDKRVKVMRLDINRGAGYARNESIKRAQGRYIAFCDSDDRWMPQKIEKQIAFMEKHNCALCYGSYILCNDEDKEKGIVIAPSEMTLNRLMHDNKIGCLTAIYDVKRTGKKYYMPELRKRQDWGLFLTILKDIDKAYGMKEPLAYYRIRPKSVSSRKLELVKYNIKVYEQVLGFSPMKAKLYFTFVFLPSHFLKLAKRRINSYFYLREKGQ